MQGTEVTRNDHRRVKDVEVHEQVVELAGEENLGAGSLGGLEEVVEEEFYDETETESQDDPKGDKVTEVQYSKTVTSEGTSWALEEGAVHLMLPTDAVSEPTAIVVRRWKYSVRSPPLQENEAITSNVIELSSMNGQGLKFNTKVKLSLSHSATDLLGYELVIKKLIDKEANKWEDIDGTRDLRRCQDQPSHMKIPDLFFPVAQADISECSTYAVVCRLKASPAYTVTSGGGSFSHPDFPGVTVTIPENAVAPTAKFSLELKVQEVSNEEFEGEDIVLGPVLRIKCNHAIHFLKPVNIQLPISLREQRDVGLNPPTTGHVRVLFLKSDNGQKEWIEITDDLVTPPSLDRKSVRFDVERFSGYSHYVERRNESFRSYGTRVINVLNRHNFVQPRLAVFFAYFRPNLLNILCLICCPAHLKRRVVKDLEKQGIRPEWNNSKKDMVPGHEKAFVSVSGGICPYIKMDMEQIFLRFLENHSDDAELDVCFRNDEKVARVEFYSSLKPRAPLLCRLHLKKPSQGTDRSDLREPTLQASTLKEGNPTEDELECLSAEVSDHWRKLGRRLAFKEAQLQEFDSGYGEISEKAYAMLLAWKQRDGSGATYSVLHKALCDERLNRRDLAQKFCCY